MASVSRPNSKRHSSHCGICSHPQREEIERDFVHWVSPQQIALEYKLSHRSCVYRHAHATGLDLSRSRNLRTALERIVERVGDVDVTAGAIVQAVALLARINSRGELIPNDEATNLHELFAKTNSAELEAYAKDGTVPSSFPRSLHTKPRKDSGGDENA